jgi:hypothetical protein
LIVTLAACLAAWVAVSAGLESLARQVEVRLDAHLWRYEEWMQLFSPARYPAEERGRILVIGPSESREAFWPAPFRDSLRHGRLVNDSLSLSTFEDAITQLEYIEKVYGTGAIGDLLLVAVTPRFLQGYTPGERPLPIALNRYSPHFSLDESVEPQALVKKGPLDSVVARIRLAGHAGARYTKAIRALLFAAQARLTGGDIERAFRAHYLIPARFFDQGPRDKTEYYDLARSGTGYNPPLRSMDLRLRRAEVQRDFRRLREIASRNRARVLVVNMPEGGWARGYFYDPGIHEAYMTVLQEAVGDLPFIDLREALTDDGFVDWVHPTMDAGLAISRRVAAEIRKLES